MKQWWAAAIVAMLVAACAGTAAPPRISVLADQFIAAGDAPDPAAMQKLVRRPVFVGGLWFTDPTCVSFSPAVEVPQARLPELARCLAGLHLRRVDRRTGYPDVVVLTYGPGFEVEARIVDGLDGPWLAAIGFESRRDARDGLPTVSPAALEAVRTGGVRDAAIDAATGAALLAHAQRFGQTNEFAWFKLCVDADGKVTGTSVREASSFAAADVFTANARQWTFSPFQAGGHAIPVCAMELAVYPPDKPAGDGTMLPPAVAEDVAPAMFVPREALGARDGEIHIHPSEDDMALIARANASPIIATQAYCLDAAGAVISAVPVRSSGLASYDAKLAAGIRLWKYAPYSEGSGARSVCSVATFVYSIR